MENLPDNAPDPKECLVCFLERMLERSGCDGSLRWTKRWLDVIDPRTPGLEATIRANGGFCDCEAAINVFGALASHRVAETT